MRVKKGTRIENPRSYGSADVEQLRNLLEGASPIQPDPRRENCYEIESHSGTFYVHISPVSGNVVLLAKWLRQPQEGCTHPEELVTS